MLIRIHCSLAEATVAVIPWSRVLVELLIITHLFRKSPPFIEMEFSLMNSQKPVMLLCPESVYVRQYEMYAKLRSIEQFPMFHVLTQRVHYVVHGWRTFSLQPHAKFT
jgi:hypothetical protein